MYPSITFADVVSYVSDVIFLCLIMFVAMGFLITILNCTPLSAALFVCGALIGFAVWELQS